MNLKIFKNTKFEKVLNRLIEITAIITVFMLAFTVNRTNYLYVGDLSGSDIYYEYGDAVNLTNIINPYEKILTGNLFSNNKYATLFPLYYFFLLGIASISQYNFAQFIDNYRIVLFGAECAVFIFTYLKFRKLNKGLLGFTAASYLILNRWAINNISAVKQDMIAIALLMASLFFLDSKKRVSYLLYGLSLGIKHLGVFFLPVYLLPIVDKELKWKEFIINLCLMASPIVLPAIPFIISNYKGFFLSLIFSFTRAPASSGTNPLYGYEKLLVLYGSGNRFSLVLSLLPRLPLFLFFLLNTVLLFTRKIPRFTFALFSIVIFITFNPVYFDQYFLWISPFILYGASDK